MNENTFMEKLADVPVVNKSRLDSEFQLDNGVMDSMTLRKVMALIDECYNVSVSGQEVNNCGSVSDMLNLIHGKIEK